MWKDYIDPYKRASASTMEQKRWWFNEGNISLFEDRFGTAKLKGEEKLQISLKIK